MLTIDYIQSGDAIKFVFTVRDFPEDDTAVGDLLDPTTLTFTLYNHKYEEISSAVLSASNRVSLGVYSYVLQTTTDMDERTYVVEIAVAYSGITSVKRDSFRLRML